MYSKVTVIGLGTIGGFLCKNISEIDSVKEIVLVDYDIVEGKNIFKSIYNSTHIGEYKVNILSEIIGDDVAVTKVITKYEEGKTILPKSDLVIDCRDVVCNRKTEIDVRIYITGRVLIIDCRKNVQNLKCYDGSYSIQLPKHEINKAAFFASQIISSGDIKTMINNNLVQRIDLDLLEQMMSKSIEDTMNNKMDMIYELSNDSQRLQCIEENVKPLLELNKKQDIEVYVGEIDNHNFLSIPVVNTSQHSIIPKDKCNNSFDIIEALTEIVSLQPNISNYIVTMRNKNGKKYVELLEETGAA